MIHKTRIEMAIIVLDSERSVAEAQNAVGNNNYVVAQFTGSPPTYRVIPIDVFPGEAAQTKLRDLPYCSTATLARSTRTDDANTEAVNNPHLLYLVLDKHGAPLGLFLAEDDALGPIGSNAQAVKNVGCPECTSHARAKRGSGATLHCIQYGHSFTKSDYEPA